VPPQKHFALSVVEVSGMLGKLDEPQVISQSTDRRSSPCLVGNRQQRAAFTKVGFGLWLFAVRRALIACVLRRIQRRLLKRG